MKPVIAIENLNFYYGRVRALKNINMEIPENRITALIGPSGCGKSTFLKVLNRMNDLIEGARTEGEVLFNGRNIYKDNDVIELRKQIGMVFQKPNPFPVSIYDNIAYGPRLHRKVYNKELDRIVENSLKSASLWEEVKDRLGSNATGLSGGQQYIKPLIDIPRMAVLAREMVTDCLNVYMGMDMELARGISQKDDEIDALYKQVFRELLVYMMESPRTINQATQFLMVSRFLERIGDHATNVCEWAIYAATGKRTDLNE